MKDVSPKPGPPVLPVPAGTGRSARLGRIHGLIVVIFALCFPAVTPAPELDPAEHGPLLPADPQIAALEQALTNAARQKAQAREEAPLLPKPVGHSALNVAAALLVAAVLTALRLAPRVKRRFSAWIPKPASRDDLAADLLQEPSIIAFFEVLNGGPAGPVATSAAQAQASPRGLASDAAPDRLQELYDTTLRRLAELRTFLFESSRSPNEAARQTRLLESFERASALRESAGLAEVLPIWQVSFALEGLLKRLSTRPADLSPSVVRTMTDALDLLEQLCSKRVKADLVTEPPVRLLAVDDDPISRRAMSLALAKVFKEPDLAPHGRAALEIAGRQAYDVIFLDVEMPGMDGFELCTKIHETELNRTTPVVFVTRHSDVDSHAKSTHNGGHSLLGKPFLVFELVLKATTLVLQGRLGQGLVKPDFSNSSNGQCHPPGKPWAPGLATGLSLEALAPLEELYQKLRAAQQDAEPADHLEFLGDLYLDVHAVRAAAERAELGAAFRLGFALESLLKKMLECPKAWTPSNIQAVVAALDLLLDVCRTGANPDLAQPPIQLLVVDDDPVARRAISGTLQLAFGRPDSVESGQAALQLAREKPFDLIFLDVQMPGMDGFAACTRIHQTPRNHLTPVVFVTSYDDLDSRAQAAASGGCGFVPKQVLACQLTLVALSFILRGRLGMEIPTLKAPASLAHTGSDPASPESAAGEDPSVARALGAV